MMGTHYMICEAGGSRLPEARLFDGELQAVEGDDACDHDYEGEQEGREGPRPVHPPGGGLRAHWGGPSRGESGAVRGRLGP